VAGDAGRGVDDPAVGPGGEARELGETSRTTARAAGPAFVHPSAIVEPGAILGPGTKVWHFCHVRSGARVGAGAVLGQNVYVSGAVRVGDRCRIQNNVSLYDGVELEDAVFVGPSVVFTNVRRPRAFRSQHGAFGAIRVGRGATLGANATVVCGTPRPLCIGAYGLVAAGAVVTRDVAAHALVVGAPARQRGWVCRCGGDLGLADAPRPSLGERRAPGGGGRRAAVEGRWSCAACGDIYGVEGTRASLLLGRGEGEP